MDLNDDRFREALEHMAHTGRIDGWVQVGHPAVDVTDADLTRLCGLHARSALRVTHPDRGHLDLVIVGFQPDRGVVAFTNPHTDPVLRWVMHAGGYRVRIAWPDELDP